MDYDPMNVESSDPWDVVGIINSYQRSTVVVQCMTKTGNQHPLQPANITNCTAVHKRCTLVFTLVAGPPTMVGLDLTALHPNVAQPVLSLAPTLKGSLCTSDMFCLVNPGDYHEIELVPEYRKHHRSHRPHYSVNISIEGECAFQWNTVIHHPGYAKQKGQGQSAPFELHLETDFEAGTVNSGLFPYQGRERHVHQPSTDLAAMMHEQQLQQQQQSKADLQWGIFDLPPQEQWEGLLEYGIPGS